MLQFMVEILMKKLEGKMFKAMHHYMGLSVDDYSHSLERNLEAYIKIYNEERENNPMFVFSSTDPNCMPNRRQMSKEGVNQMNSL